MALTADDLAAIDRQLDELGKSDAEISAIVARAREIVASLGDVDAALEELAAGRAIPVAPPVRARHEEPSTDVHAALFVEAQHGAADDRPARTSDISGLSVDELFADAEPSAAPAGSGLAGLFDDEPLSLSESELGLDVGDAAALYEEQGLADALDDGAPLGLADALEDGELARERGLADSLEDGELAGLGGGLADALEDGELARERGLADSLEDGELAGLGGGLADALEDGELAGLGGGLADALEDGELAGLGGGLADALEDGELAGLGGGLADALEDGELAGLGGGLADALEDGELAGLEGGLADALADNELAALEDAPLGLADALDADALEADELADAREADVAPEAAAPSASPFDDDVGDGGLAEALAHARAADVEDVEDDEDDEDDWPADDTGLMRAVDFEGVLFEEAASATEREASADLVVSEPAPAPRPRTIPPPVPSHPPPPESLGMIGEEDDEEATNLLTGADFARLTGAASHSDEFELLVDEDILELDDDELEELSDEDEPGPDGDGGERRGLISRILGRK